MARPFRTVSIAGARALSDKKADDVLLLDVARLSPLTDFLLIVTALSAAHLEALEQEVKKTLKDFQLHCLHRARPASDQWRVLDFGGLIVHLMVAEARGFYALEKLYNEAPRVKWEAAAAKAAPKKAHARAR